MVRIYGPATMTERGATLTMNFYDPDGHLVDYRRVEELASERRISLRTGCFCNPGAGEAAEGLTEADMRAAMEAGVDMNLSRFVQLMQTRGGKAAGAIRVSFGLVSNIEDASRFLSFAEELRDQTRLTLGDVSFDIESCRVIRRSHRLLTAADFCLSMRRLRRHLATVSNQPGILFGLTRVLADHAANITYVDIIPHPDRDAEIYLEFSVESDIDHRRRPNWSRSPVCRGSR